MALPPSPVDRLGSSQRSAGCHLGVMGWLRAVLLVTVAVLTACTPGQEDAGTGPAASDTPATSAPTQEPGEEPDRESQARMVPALHPAIDDLEETVVTIDSGGRQVEVAAKVAEAPEERARGLMEVPALPEGVGMLFLFDARRTGGFWMWNTLIGLDIAFIGADGKAHTLATMVPCGSERSADCPVTTPPEPYRAALEVPGGWFDSVGVEPGASVTWTEPQPVIGP